MYFILFFILKIGFGYKKTLISKGILLCGGDAGNRTRVLR